MKERLMVDTLRCFIENDREYHIALLAGLRKTGKTTILKQLQSYYPDSVYIDLSQSPDGYLEIQEAFFEQTVSLLLLDEITYLDDYELIAQSLYNYKNGKLKYKVIITGSSLAHIVKLYCTKLGGGRARFYRLPLLTFIEYLYFTGRIGSYADYDNVSNSDFSEYLQLKGLDATEASELVVTFDSNYFQSFYMENTVSNSNTRISYSKIDLKVGDLESLLDLIAYKLGDFHAYSSIIKPKVGGKEHISLFNEGVKFSIAKTDLSSTFVNVSSRIIKSVPASTKGRILRFLLDSGLAYVQYVDRAESVEDTFDIGEILSILGKCEKESELIRLFSEVTINIVSPLFYTRLGFDIIKQAGISPDKLCSGMMLGMMLEMYLCGSICSWSDNAILVSRKLDYPNIGEVDIFSEKHRLLCESTISDKESRRIHVSKYYKSHYLIRVCSSRTKNVFNGDYYQIPYAKLCCMVDTGDLFHLDKTTIAENY